MFRWSWGIVSTIFFLSHSFSLSVGSSGSKMCIFPLKEVKNISGSLQKEQHKQEETACSLTIYKCLVIWDRTYLWPAYS